MRAVLFEILICITFGTPFAYGQEGIVQSITVRSSWGGLGKAGNSEIAIRREGDHYVSEQGDVELGLIESFRRAISEPLISRPDSANLGITPNWLKRNVDEAGRHSWLVGYNGGSEAQKDVFREAFEDTMTLQKRLNLVFEGSHTDDYPQISLTVTLGQGVVVQIETDSQNPYMLPWEVNGARTFNANIARSLMALLPDGFTNRERLGAAEEYFTGLLQALAEVTGNQVKAQWDLVGAQQKAEGALRVLKQVYKVRRASVDPYQGLDFGVEPTDRVREENLEVDLWRPGFPRNFLLSADLLRRNQKVEGAETLLAKAPSYENLILSIDWLRKYWSDHPGEYAWLRFVHDRSFSEKAMRIFAEDMKGSDKIEIVEKVRAVQDKAALLITGHGDYWIVLPDKSMILWRRQNFLNVLQWTPNSFPEHECSQYVSVTGGCTGVVISREGKIVP